MSLGIMRNFLFRIYTIGFPLYETIQIIENKGIIDYFKKILQDLNNGYLIGLYLQLY